MGTRLYECWASEIVCQPLVVYNASSTLLSLPTRSPFYFMISSRLLRISACFLIALGLIAAIYFDSMRGLGSQVVSEAPRTAWKQIALLADREISESSGLILSERNPDCFWTHNDSGDAARLFLVHRDGRTIARLKVAGVNAIDWEDIAFATIDGTPKIIVGDIGGNAQKRNHVTLYVLSEPKFLFDASKPARPIESSAKVETSVDVTFEGGVTNYEGIAVDHAGKSILIFEKALLGGRVYSLPLPELSKRKTEAQAKLIAKTSIPIACACDISTDSRSMVVVTYQVGCLFTRKTKDDGTIEDWSEALKRDPLFFPLPKMRQTEAVCFSTDAKSIFLTSEQLPTPIIEMQLPSATSLP